MGLGIKLLWTEGEELKDRIRRWGQLYPFPSKSQQKQMENAKLKLHDINNRLQKIGKESPITVVVMHSTGINEPRTVYYTTHDDEELQVMFKRDFPHRTIFQIQKVFTAISYRDL